MTVVVSVERALGELRGDLDPVGERELAQVQLAPGDEPGVAALDHLPAGHRRAQPVQREPVQHVEVGRVGVERHAVVAELAEPVRPGVQQRDPGRPREVRVARDAAPRSSSPAWRSERQNIPSSAAKSASRLAGYQCTPFIMYASACASPDAFSLALLSPFSPLAAVDSGKTR